MREARKQTIPRIVPAPGSFASGTDFLRRKVIDPICRLFPLRGLHKEKIAC